MYTKCKNNTIWKGELKRGSGNLYSNVHTNIEFQKESPSEEIEEDSEDTKSSPDRYNFFEDVSNFEGKSSLFLQQPICETLGVQQTF